MHFLIQFLNLRDLDIPESFRSLIIIDVVVVVLGWWRSIIVTYITYT